MFSRNTAVSFFNMQDIPAQFNLEGDKISDEVSPSFEYNFYAAELSSIGGNPIIAASESCDAACFANISGDFLLIATTGTSTLGNILES